MISITHKVIFLINLNDSFIKKSCIFLSKERIQIGMVVFLWQRFERSKFDNWSVSMFVSLIFNQQIDNPRCSLIKTEYSSFKISIISLNSVWSLKKVTLISIQSDKSPDVHKNLKCCLIIWYSLIRSHCNCYNKIQNNWILKLN